MEHVSHIERMVYTEVAAILAHNSVTDRGELYARITKSLLAGDSSLQARYDRQIAKAKQDRVWNAIYQNHVILKIQEHHRALLQEITTLFQTFNIPDSGDLYKRVVDCVMDGAGLMELLELEISQEELDEIAPSLTDYISARKFQLPPHITPSSFPPPLQLDPHPYVPISPFSPIATPLSPPPFPSKDKHPISNEWILIFQRHSVLWKFHNDFYKIEEWAFYGHPTRQIARLIVEDCKDIPSFNKRLFSALFFLIKRQQDLTSFVDSLLECFIDFGVECEQYSVRFFINLLLFNSDKLLRQKLIHLASTSNPIPLTEFVLHNNTYYQQFTAEPFILFEETQFLLYSYGMDKIKGKSMLLNRIFGTSFETSKNSHFFKGTIDYQADRMFVPSRGVTIADGHGLVDDPFMFGMLKISDGVIIHLNAETWNSSTSRVREEIQTVLRHGVQFVVVLVRDVVEFNNKKVLDSFESPDNIARLGDIAGSSSTTVLVFQLPSLMSGAMVDYYVRRMREKIMECLWGSFGVRSPSIRSTSDDEGRDTTHLKNKLDGYISLLEESQAEGIGEVRTVVTDLINDISRAMQDNHSRDISFLQIYPKFRAAAQLRNQLITTRFSNSNEKHAKRTLLFQLIEEVRLSEVEDVSEIVNKFELLVGGNLNWAKIFLFMEALKRLVQEELYSGAASPSNFQKPLLKCSEIDESKAISTEVLWREINQLFLLGRPCEAVCMALESLLQIGEWFEVIDGNNIYMPFQFLHHTFANSFVIGKRVLVIGVLGPQNSGKTTLLNFMFGCNISASQARTTKGVYGCLIDSPIEEYDLVLILDPEGLHTGDLVNADYDRKVMLFMLAACDVVIFNFRDQAHDRMGATLEVCAKSLSSLHNTKVPQPIIFFVQSQRPNQCIHTDLDIPQQALVDVFANITQDELNDIIQLAPENFVSLPAAFHAKDIAINTTHKWQRLAALPKFVERVASFMTTVFSKIRQRQIEFNEQGITFSDLQTWLEFANSTFNNLCKFDDLTRFGDILEEKQDQFVKKWLHIIIDGIVSSEKKETIFALGDCIEGIETYFRVATAETERELVDMLEKNQIKTVLHKPHLDDLKVIMENSRSNWIVDANIRVENERLQTEASNGQLRINDKVREILRVGRKFTRDQLSKIFDACFEITYEELMKRRDRVEASIKNLCMSIVYIYKLYCADLPNSEEIALEIDIDQTPEVKLEHLVAQLEYSNYSEMTYSLPNPPETVDERIITSSGWVFVMGSAISKIKQGLADYLSFTPIEQEVEDNVISDIFMDKPLKNRILGSMTKWLTSWIGSDTGSELTSTKLAMYLMRAVKRALAHSPQLIAELVNVRLPFDMVRSKAQEMQLQERMTSTEVIHRCVAYVNDEIIFPFDLDLRPFGLAITKTMRAGLHMLMVQYLVAFNFRYHTKRLDEPVTAKLRDSWKATFMEQTLRGPARDASNVEILVTKLDDAIQQRCLEGARREFRTVIKQFDKEHTRLSMQRQFERDLENKTKEELLKYVHDPVGVLGAYFDALWRRDETKMNEAARLVYHTEGNNLVELELWVAAVHREIESTRFSNANELFFAPAGIGSVQALLKKEMATVLLYCDLLNGRPRSKRYTIEGTELDLVDWDVAPMEGRRNHVEKLDQLLLEISAIQTISDLNTFSSRLASRLATLGNQLRRHQCFTAVLDPENRLQTARAHAIGCDQLCPCCKRCCDEEHWRYTLPVGKGENRHKCRLGHQNRGMAGFAFETKFASLKVCGGMQDDEKVWYQDRYFLWSEFKERFPSWDFHYPVEEDAANWMPKIWDLVGEDLCIEYGIQFTAADQSYTELAKHFIFLVGITESMKKNWQYFLRAANKFAEKKIQKEEKVSHTVSCITFTNRATSAFHDLLLSEDLFTLDSVIPLHPAYNDKTSFSAALALLLDLMKKQTSRAPAVIIMLSDGDDSFPHKELKRLCEDEVWKKIDSFWAVAFGAKALQGTLMGMAQWMVKGYSEKWHFRNPKDFTELVDHYAEIANET